MNEIVNSITQQALDNFDAVRRGGCIVIPEDQWKRLVLQIFIGGRDKDVIHLMYKEDKKKAR